MPSVDGFHRRPRPPGGDQGLMISLGIAVVEGTAAKGRVPSETGNRGRRWHGNPARRALPASVRAAGDDEP